jgi:hypothetical protein
MEKENKEQRLAGLKRLGRSLIGAGLPALGTAVAGPIGGQVVGGILRGLGLKDGSSISDVERALDTDPDAAVKLKQLEVEVAMAQLDLAGIEEKELTNRLESDNNSDSWLAKNIRPVTLGILTIGYLVYIYSVMFILDGPELETATTFGLQLSMLLGSVTSFYFGSRGFEKISKIKKNDK